jgi:hypothetical protein
MFRLIKVVVGLVILISAGMFLYDKFSAFCCDCDEVKCC